MDDLKPSGTAGIGEHEPATPEEESVEESNDETFETEKREDAELDDD